MYIIWPSSAVFLWYLIPGKYLVILYVQEHHYHVLENDKETIPPDADAPELLPSFKPELSLPSIYQDINSCQ